MVVSKKWFHFGKRTRSFNCTSQFGVVVPKIDSSVYYLIICLVMETERVFGFLLCLCLFVCFVCAMLCSKKAMLGH